MATRDEAVHPYTPYGLPALVPSRRGWQRTELDRIRANASVKVVDLTGSDPADPILGREAAGDNLARIYRSSAVAKGNSAKTYSKGADGTDDNDDDLLSVLEFMAYYLKRTITGAD